MTTASDDNWGVSADIARSRSSRADAVEPMTTCNSHVPMDEMSMLQIDVLWSAGVSQGLAARPSEGGSEKDEVSKKKFGYICTQTRMCGNNRYETPLSG